ncbi:hypothetical protein OG210_21855 [Streptomyces sp. NBC_00466]|uniref:hypothetical protein n=1 Tax=Streptomyces sp. NBC_00466 TaxID=2903655 RepID=UPI0030E495C2
MIEEHPSELRADIVRYFPGRSLNEFHRNESGAGTMTWLELWEFYLGLPYDSMTKSAMAGDHGHRRWTESDYLLREILALLQFQSRIAWIAGQLQGPAPDLPPWPHPDLRLPEQIEADRELAVARAERARKFHEAMKPGSQNTEYLNKLAAVRAEHQRLAAERQRSPGGEDPAPPDN